MASPPLVDGKCVDEVLRLALLASREVHVGARPEVIAGATAPSVGAGVNIRPERIAMYVGINSEAEQTRLSEVHPPAVPDG